MLYALTVSVKNQGTWRVPAETAEELQRLLAWKLKELGPNPTSLVRWIEVEVNAPLKWPTISYGSGAAWTISMDPINNGGKLQVEFHQPEAFADGHRQFLVCLQFVTKLVALHRKASLGQEHVRKHRYDAAERMFAECQDLSSGLLFLTVCIR